jgi:site-specific recombinase XerC
MPHSPQPLKDIIVLMRELGMRNARELYCMKIELIHWDSQRYFVPDSKSPAGRREIPLTERAIAILASRCGKRGEGWLFPSRQKGKHITGGLVNKQWVKARKAAGLPEALVLYAGRHDYGTFLMEATGNLKAVMLAMGHRDYKSALRYQRPRLDRLRDALNDRSKKTAVLEFKAQYVAQR